MAQEPRRDYSDIIDLPHHVSGTRKPMSRLNRAAQFAPFAALTGYGAAIEETARLTERRVEPGEAELAALNGRLLALRGRLPARATVTWFVPDARKEGGRYVTEETVIRRILPEQGRLVLDGDRSVDFDCLLEIELPEGWERNKAGE